MWSHATQVVVALATAVYAVAAVFTYFAVQETNRLSRITIRLNRDTLELTQAADMLIDVINCLTGQQPVSRATTIFPVFRNYGRTSATNFRATWHLRLPGFPKKPADEQPSRSVVPAGGTVVAVALSFGNLVGKDDEAMLKLIQAGKIPIAFDAQALYSDVFGREHVTDISAVFAPNCFFVVQSVTQKTTPELTLSN